MSIRRPCVGTINAYQEKHREYYSYNKKFSHNKDILVYFISIIL